MAVTKRIFQLSKEFERDEKEIIAFLATQGIKVSNRLSAVSEEAYNMLKAKFAAPPEPEPAPEPAPQPAQEVKETAPAESTEAPTQPNQPEQQNQPAQGNKKKKKKNKPAQPAAETTEQPQQPGQEQTEEPTFKVISDEKVANMAKRTQTILCEGIKAGNEFINHYTPNAGSTTLLNNKNKPILTANMDIWGVLYNHKFEYPDSSPARYWQSVAKLMTRAFKVMNGFGLANKEALAEMRNAMMPLGTKYQPREIFTDEENQKFEAQQKLLFVSFGHGMGLVNDNLYDLKLKAERMKVKYERMSFLEYVTNPQDELRSNDRVPFNELVEAVVYSIRGVARRFEFYQQNKERINKIITRFFEWLDGYAKLKEQGADAAKLEKYLELEEKFISIAEYMSFDNLIYNPASKQGKKNKPAPFDLITDLLINYRDILDDPDAERDFKYKVRGVTNIIYKPKEYVFIYRFAGLEPNKDYRPPEVIAAAEAAKKAAEAEAAKKAAEAEAAKAAAETTEQEENPADNDEA